MPLPNCSQARSLSGSFRSGEGLADEIGRLRLPRAHPQVTDVSVGVLDQPGASGRWPRRRSVAGLRLATRPYKVDAERGEPHRLMRRVLGVGLRDGRKALRSHGMSRRTRRLHGMRQDRKSVGFQRPAQTSPVSRGGLHKWPKAVPQVPRDRQNPGLTVFYPYVSDVCACFARTSLAVSFGASHWKSDAMSWTAVTRWALVDCA